MTDLWSQRLAKHQRQQFKYLRLVFNDHFVIALIFMLGGLGYAYSNALKGLTHPVWWAKPLGLIVLLIVLGFGHLATLVEEADTVFLLPKEESFPAYLERAWRYSLLLPSIVMIFAVLALAPFLWIGAGMTMWGLLFLGVTELVLKALNLKLAVLQRYQMANWQQHTSWLFYGFSLLVLAAAFYIHPLVGVVLAVLGAVYARMQQRQVGHFHLRWQYLAATEKTRMFNLYRFYNLFTDVPGMGSRVKRRSYLDFIANWVKPTHDDAYGYLFIRGFLRGTEYSGLYIRFVILGSIILYFSSQWVLALILFALFLYMTGFQLLPFYHQYDGIIFTHLYPLSDQQKQRSFERLVQWLMGVQWGIGALVILVVWKFTMPTAIILIATFVEVLAFVRIYTPQRLRPQKRIIR